jgi:hypothetical protein
MTPALLLVLLQSVQVPAPAPRGARLELRPEAATIRAGDSIRIEARLSDPAGRAVSDLPIVWSASGEGTVDAAGLVRAGYAGFVRVTATAAGYTANATIGVRPRPTASVEIRPTVRRIVAGTRVTLNGWAFSPDGDRTYEPVTFRSSAPRVAMITAEGRLVAVAPGRVTITASAGAVRDTLALEVARNTVAMVTVTPPVASVRAGDVIRFKAPAADARGRPLPSAFVEWSAAALTYKAVAQIDARGAFVAEWPGKYTVTADIGGRRADAIVEVRRRDLGAALEVIGRLALPFPAEAFALGPGARCAYVGTDGGPLYVVDVARPDAVRVVDSLKGAGRVTAVRVSAERSIGVFARQGGAGGGLVVFDARMPCRPRVLAVHPASDSSGTSAVWLDRVHAYAADAGTGSLRIVDLSDAAHPREVGRWETATIPGRRLEDVSVTDGVAYLAYWNDGLVILDVGNGIRNGRPDRPALVAQYRYDLNDMYHWVDRAWGLGARGTHRARRVGDVVLISDEVHPAKNRGTGLVFGRLNAIDVADLTRPNGVAWYDPADAGIQDIWIDGDTAYLAAAGEGVRVLDVGGELKGNLLAQGRELARLWTVDSIGIRPFRAMAGSVEARNGLIYALDRNTGLWIARSASRPSE